MSNIDKIEIFFRSFPWWFMPLPVIMHVFFIRWSALGGNLKDLKSNEDLFIRYNYCLVNTGINWYINGWIFRKQFFDIEGMRWFIFVVTLIQAPVLIWKSFFHLNLILKGNTFFIHQDKYNELAFLSLLLVNLIFILYLQFLKCSYIYKYGLFRGYR